MSRLDNSEVADLFESAEETIPDLDGHDIRVAERRILWSKLAQLMPPSATPEQVAAWEKAQPDENLMPPSATPEQVAAWEKAQGQAQPGQELAPPPPTSQTQQQLAQLTQQLATKTPVAAPAKPAPTGVAHMKHHTPKPQEMVINVPEMVIEPLNYTPGPGDANYVGASKNIISLVKVADYLSKKAQNPNANRAIAMLKGSFHNCFNRELNRNPDAQGKIDLAIAIGTDGKVKDVEATVTGNLGSAVECVKSVARNAQFDPSMGGTTLRVPVAFMKQN